MVATSRSKPIDKPEALRRLATLLKKSYPGTPPRRDLPVLETLLFAVCLEDATLEQAEVAYQHLLKSFPDLNEARVSSITELQQVLLQQSDPAWRALRVKSILQHAFDAHYAFELEGLKRKTSDLAIKALGKIPALSWFVRGYALQQSLDSHALPLDGRMLGVLVWVGLVEPDTSAEVAAEQLRSHVRKAEAPLLTHLLRSLAHDPKRNRVFQPTGRGIDCAATVEEGLHRLEVLLSKGPASVPKAQPRPEPPPVKTASGKSPAGKPVASKLPAKGESKQESGPIGKAALDTSMNGVKKPATDRLVSAKGGPERTPTERVLGHGLGADPGKVSPSKTAPVANAVAKGALKSHPSKTALPKGASGTKATAGKATGGVKPVAPGKSGAVGKVHATRGGVSRSEHDKAQVSGGKGKGGAVRTSSGVKPTGKNPVHRSAGGKPSLATKPPSKRS